MADLATVLKAAPIGLLMLLGSYVASRRRKSGWSRAAKEFPALADRLGVTFRAPPSPTRIGTLRGTFRGYDVFVDPDDRPRLVVYFGSAPPVILRTFELEKRVPSGMQRLETQNPLVDRFFKDRYVAPESADELSDCAGEFETRIVPFAVKWRNKVTQVSITPERLECEFDFGRPLHLPPEVVEELLPEAVELSRFLESRTLPPERSPSIPPAP
jgi:hypothetical protein